MTKRLLAIILSAVMVLSVCACGGKPDIGDCSGYIQRDIKWDMNIEDIENTIEYKKNDGVKDNPNGLKKYYVFNDVEMQSFDGIAVYNIGESVNMFSFVFYDEDFVKSWYENFFLKRFGEGKKVGEDTQYQYSAVLDGQKCTFTLYLDKHQISVKKD